MDTNYFSSLYFGEKMEGNTARVRRVNKEYMDLQKEKPDWLMSCEAIGGEITHWRIIIKIQVGLKWK